VVVVVVVVQNTYCATLHRTVDWIRNIDHLLYLEYSTCILVRTLLFCHTIRCVLYFIHEINTM